MNEIILTVDYNDELFRNDNNEKSLSAKTEAVLKQSILNNPSESVNYINTDNCDVIYKDLPDWTNNSNTDSNNNEQDVNKSSMYYQNGLNRNFINTNHETSKNNISTLNYTNRRNCNRNRWRNRQPYNNTNNSNSTTNSNYQQLANVSQITQPLTSYYNQAPPNYIQSMSQQTLQYHSVNEMTDSTLLSNFDYMKRYLQALTNVTANVINKSLDSIRNINNVENGTINSFASKLNNTTNTQTIQASSYVNSNNKQKSRR